MSKVKEFEDELIQYLNDTDLCAETYYDEYNMAIVVEIEWGDWKHQHLYAVYLIEEFLKSKNIQLLQHIERVTEENGSDCYSAIHYFLIKE
jgi:hypothetical protein